jgi:hypothetical protein
MRDYLLFNTGFIGGVLFAVLVGDNKVLPGFLVLLAALFIYFAIRLTKVTP